MKKLIIAGLFVCIGIFAGSYAVWAQVPALGSGAYPCWTFSQYFGYGSRDAVTDSGVSQLQQYLGISPTGYFGPITRSKLEAFQNTYGIPATGYFGPMSRARLILVTCGTNPPVPLPGSSAPTVSNLSPTSGVVGTQVTITGSGFNSDSYVLFGGGTSGGSVSSYDGTHITFDVPSSVGAPCNLFSTGSLCPQYARLITPGTYPVSIETANGTSNSMQFTVTGSACVSGSCAEQPPVITGGNFPTTLAVSQTGTWTINAYDPESGPLNYSVNWGDNSQCYPYACPMAAPGTAVQQSSSFTHSYSAAGTYTVTFIVTNNQGLTAQSSSTIQVGGVPQGGAPSISYLSPSIGAVGTVVTIHGGRFAPTGNTITFDGIRVPAPINPGYLGCDAQPAYGPYTCNNYDFASPDGVTLVFTVPSTSMVCPPNAICAAPRFVSANDPVVVTNANGTSNSMDFTLTGTSQANDSGISGTVTLGPTCPVQSYPPQQGCGNQPYSTTLGIVTYGNSEYVSTTTTSDANGNFSIALPVGSYTISSQNSNAYPRLSPQIVNVLPHQYTNVNLTFDTGIR